MQQTVPGDNVCMFIGDWNPPTHDLRHACLALSLVPEIKRIWLCPVSMETSKEARTHIANVNSIFCTEFAAEHSKVITCCTVGLSKGFRTASEFRLWAVTKFPFLQFSVAEINPQHENNFSTYSIRFASQPYPKNSPHVKPISLDKNIFIGDVKGKIQKGSDESRNMYYGVWTYVQETRLYR